MGLLFSSRSGSSKVKAQTNFGGEGFQPDEDEEYKALQGIEVINVWRYATHERRIRNRVNAFG